MHGRNLETLSRLFYQHYTNSEVLEVSIVPHNTYSYIGATPDGFSIVDGKEPRLLEIKCPTRRKIPQFSSNIFNICPYHYLA